MLIFLAGCTSEQSLPKPQTLQPEAITSTAERIEPTTLAKIKKLDVKYLPNPVWVHEKVISGGLPEGDEAFAELRGLGIKTLISVDGAKPDVMRAEKYGMRYVHLPYSYDGVPEQLGKQLAKAVRDLPGPLYLHCHHGRHRSPAAAAVACVGAGFISHDEAGQVLKIAGTSESYRGLFQSVDAARPLDAKLLDAMPTDFPPIANVPAMVDAMVAIEQLHDHLKSIENAGWNSPRDLPALTPVHEILLLREYFRELRRSDETKAKPEAFRQLAEQAEMLCQTLEATLTTSTIDIELASKQFAAVSANCKRCHQEFRDEPSRGKLSNLREQ
jgi:protein tyrosine phosphatase (PTP) superfamily phosphohydrolase (DUF442 family)